jgi:hypothetical protein
LFGLSFGFIDVHVNEADIVQLMSWCTTCGSCDWDPEHQDNKTDVGALNEDEDDCSGL